MDKKAHIIVAVLVLAIAGSVIFLLTNKQAEPEQQATRTPGPTGNRQNDTVPSPKRPRPASPPTVRPGTYVSYSSQAVRSASGTTLLFFHAPWCPQCRALEADIKQHGVPTGVTILKVDYDSNQALRQQYGVTLQTSFVRIDAQGKLVKKYVAYDEPTLAAVRENLL